MALRGWAPSGRGSYAVRWEGTGRSTPRRPWPPPRARRFDAPGHDDFGSADAGAVRSAADRTDQWGVLRPAEPRALGHLRTAQHHQFHPRRPVHDGRVRGVFPLAVGGARLLVGAPHRAGRRGHHRHRARAHDAQTPLSPRSSLRPLADLRFRPDHPGSVSPRIRLVGIALFDAPRARRWPESRLHVPAQLPGLGHRVLARGLPHDLVRDRADAPRLVPARRDRKPGARASVRDQRAPDDHADLRVRGRPRSAGGRARGADLSGEPAHGRRPHHRRLRGGRDRRPGLDHGLDRDGLRPRSGRGLHQGLLPRSVQHGDLRHHGARAPGEAQRPLRAGLVTATANEYVGAAAPAVTGVPIPQVVAFGVMTTVLAAAPFLVYPVFLMKALCFALFSFGHAAFLGAAGYGAAHSAKAWGFPPELAILFGTAVAAALGVVIGALAIRSKGIYFANITLAFAQMVYFFSVQAGFTLKK